MRNESSTPPQSGGDTTQISTGSKIKGEITGSTELVVQGEVDGRIQLDNSVVIGSSGVVKGEIHARTVRVSGKIIGNVRGLERVEILVDGHVEGDVVAPRVIIIDGAFFKGKVEMSGDTAQPAASASARSVGS